MRYLLVSNNYSLVVIEIPIIIIKIVLLLNNSAYLSNASVSIKCNGHKYANLRKIIIELPISKTLHCEVKVMCRSLTKVIFYS